MESIALLIKIVVVSLAVHAFVYYSGIPGKIKMWLNTRFSVPLEEIRLKPLDCHVCLSFWLTVLYLLADFSGNHLPRPADLLQILVNALAAAATSHLLYKKIK